MNIHFTNRTINLNKSEYLFQKQNKQNGTLMTKQLW